MDQLGIAKRAFRRVTARRKPAVLLVLLVFAFVLSYGLFAQKSHSIEQKNVKLDFNWNVSNKLEEQVKLDVSESEDTNSISKNLLEQPFLEDTADSSAEIEDRKPIDTMNEKNETNIDESDMKQESIQTSQSEKIDDNKNGNELDRESTESEVQQTKDLLDIPESDMNLLQRNAFADVMNHVKLGDQMRLFKQYNKKLIDLSKGNQRQEALSLTKRIEKQLFGWVQPKWQTTIELYESYKGSGLVICMGNEQVRYALVTLEIVRKVFKFELPIEVFYMGDDDLSKENQETIKEKISDVKLVDITKLFDMNTITIGGWAIKPFAVLASSFQKVLMMDSDVIFLQSPQTLFDSKLFTTKGALFFHDRTLYSQGPSTLNWMYSLMPKPPSEYSGSLRTFRKQTKHEQESGVVLIDKRERFHGILATCLLNAGGIRRYTYDRVFGDKETFWLGMEMAQEEYTFNGHYPGNLGVSKKVGGYYQLCCRQILHFDENDSPIWYNGGMQEMKRIEDSPLIKVEDYWEETGSWELFEKNMACLKAKQPPLRFNPEFKSVISQSEQIAIELGMRHQSK